MSEILAADIGGTNSRFAHFSLDGEGKLVMKGTCWLKTKESASFGDLIGRLRKTDWTLKPQDTDIAAIAVAGPIERGGLYSSPPYIDWDIDISQPSEIGLGRATLINDFVAQAWATLSPIGKSARQILPGKADPKGAIAVIGAGTGLGMAALLPDGEGGYLASPSEGGHSAFPFVTKDECRFGEFVKKDTGHDYPTGNTVVSGGGLSRIHEFLTGERLGPRDVTKRLGENSETLRWAARFYGRACRDYALDVLASGGLYIAGGVAARTPAIVEDEEFEAEFRRSPKMASVLSKIPVYLITDQDSGLWGSAYYGMKRLQQMRSGK